MLNTVSASQYLSPSVLVQPTFFSAVTHVSVDREPREMVSWS